MKKLIYKIAIYLSEKFRPATPKWSGESDHVIIPAFSSNGIQYFQFKDPFNGYSQRILEALDIYEEWSMRITRKDLAEFVTALDGVLESNHISIQEIIRIKFALQERLNYAIPNKEIIYKFASVVYFDLNESPYSYDSKYNEEKIERWKKDMSIEDFFLTVPISILIPLPDLSKIDLSNYFKVIEMAEQAEKEFLSAKAS